MKTRRVFLENYLGLGAVAATDLLAQDRRTAAKADNPLAPKPPHLPAKAKRCIFLFMEGGVSQMDTFEYKPMLEKFAGKRMPDSMAADSVVGANMKGPHRVIPSPFKFAQHGQSGRWMCELLPHLSTKVDDLAFLHGVRLESSNHPPGVFQVMTGNMFPGSAAIGSWVNYGLGTENQDLPGFVVLADGPPAVGGAAIWSSGYLPAVYQGALFRNSSTPIVDLKPRPGVTPESQRAQLDLLKWFNEEHAGARRNPSELEARLNTYEVAFRMQMEAPKLLDLSGESDATKKLYGLDDPVTAAFGRECLMARRLSERGVRFVMALHGKAKPWDDHSNIKGNLPVHCREVDRPVAGLLSDLKSRGMLDDTLVVWATEMGRQPFDIELAATAPGRNHNNLAMAMWMAGGGVRAGATYGKTDDFSLTGIGDQIMMRDVHATLLRLMGLDQQRLTFLHAGRFKKLTDIGGRVITEIIA